MIKTLVSAQIKLSFPKLKLGKELFVSVMASVPVQPLASVTVTENVPPLVGEIVGVVAPVFQLYPVKVPGFKTVGEPGQVVRFGPRLGTGSGAIVRLVEAEPEQPVMLVTVTEYMPEVVG